MNNEALVEQLYKFYCVDGVLKMPEEAVSTVCEAGAKDEYRTSFYADTGDYVNFADDSEMATQKERTVSSVYNAPDFLKEKGFAFVKAVNVKADVFLFGSEDDECNQTLKDFELTVDVELLTENK